MQSLRRGARRVEVAWIDSAARYEWHPEHEALRESEDDYMLCCSVGYVLRETSDKLTLTQSFTANHDGTRDVGGTLSIPKLAIREIKELRR